AATSAECRRKFELLPGRRQLTQADGVVQTPRQTANRPSSAPFALRGARIMDGGRFLISARGLCRALGVAVSPAALAAGLIWSAAVTAQTADAPLVLETKIPLGQVSGRID